ncbi:MAG TPA: hypothetical protein VFD06_11965 [Candidatus Polarisedimenticolia bacterium]|nr:hypothetical protein [Candidatus Polarisedimenticolia bacterium]
MTSRPSPLFGLTLIAALFAAAPASAQTATDEKELTKSVITTERQAIVAANLNLTDEQGTVFWPLYKQYGAEMDAITDRKIRLIEDYARKYVGMTDEEAAGLMSAYMAIQKDELKVRERWVVKMKKELPIKTVLRFFQIENKLDAIVRAETLRVIPLVRNQAMPTSNR